MRHALRPRSGEPLPGRERRLATKHRLVAVATALAATGALSGAALAAAPYTLKLEVPSIVSVFQAFKVKASGTSSNLSHLTVFLASKPCAASSQAEAALSSHLIISKDVVHSYAKSKTVVASSPGTYRACGYLTATAPAKNARAHASKAYAALAGGY